VPDVFSATGSGDFTVGLTCPAGMWASASRAGNGLGSGPPAVQSRLDIPSKLGLFADTYGRAEDFIKDNGAAEILGG